MSHRIETPMLPDEPPPWVTKSTLWRLARCVMRDHVIGGTGVIEVCTRCRERWPCLYRLLAEGALAETERRPRGRPVRNQAYLDLLRTRIAERTADDP